MTNSLAIGLHEALEQQPHDYLVALGQSWGLQFRGSPPHHFLAHEISKVMLDRAALVSRLAGMPDPIRKACLSLLEVDAVPKKEFEQRYGVITTFPKYLYQSHTAITPATALHATGLALLVRRPGGRTADMVVIPRDLAEGMRGALSVTLASTLIAAPPPPTQFIDDQGDRLVTLVAHVLGFMLHNGVQYTKSGDIHRGYQSKITEHLYGKSARDATILPGPTPAYLYQIMRLANICDEQEGSKVVLTVEGESYLAVDRLTQLQKLYQSWANQPVPSAQSSGYELYYDSYSGWPYQLHHEVRAAILPKLHQFPMDSWVKLDQAALAMLSPTASASALSSYSLRYFSWEGLTGAAAVHAYSQGIAKATIVSDLHEFGVIKIDRRSRDPAGQAIVALTKLGAWLIGLSDVSPQLAEPPAIIVQPSYEVILPRETAAASVVTVESVAELVTRDVASTYKLTKGRVGAALERGATIEQVLEGLRAGTPQALPSNVVHTLRDWAGTFGRIRVINGSVLVADSAPLLAELRASKKLASLLGDKLDERVCMIADRQATTLVKKLREAGHLPVVQGASSMEAVGSRAAPSTAVGIFDTNELMALYLALEACLSITDLGGSVIDEASEPNVDFETLQAKIHEMVPARNRRQLVELASTIQVAIDQLFDQLALDETEPSPDLIQPLRMVAERETRPPKS